jgi:hypothetical protein
MMNEGPNEHPPVELIDTSKAGLGLVLQEPKQAGKPLNIDQKTGFTYSKSAQPVPIKLQSDMQA